jgi:hypothetical protein
LWPWIRNKGSGAIGKGNVIRSARWLKAWQITKWKQMSNCRLESNTLKTGCLDGTFRQIVPVWIDERRTERTAR